MVTTPKSVVHHTFGFRYGVRAVYAHKRNYARGNGALAAKLTLAGDPRGREWLGRELRLATIEPVRARNLHHIPVAMLRCFYFVRAYRKCRRGYRVSPEGPAGQVRGTLRPVESDTA